MYQHTVMHPPLLALVIIVASCAAATVHALPPSAGTPAARFWANALQGTPMPEAIADLIQKGIDHSPLVEHYSVPRPKLTIIYRCDGGCPAKADVPLGLFFHKEQVRVGATMRFSFAPAVLPAILPRQIAENIPFGSLADVLSMFGIAPSSAAAARVADTLSQCQASIDVSADERKACATSLEGTVRSAMRMLGTTSRVSVAASALSSAGVPLGAYVIEAVREVDGGGRHVGCHVMPYPYAVYQCHMTLRPSKAYVISLRSLHEGRAIDLAAVCHLDTSHWSPAYPAFEILDTQPGGAPVCHFLQYADLLFSDRN